MSVLESFKLNGKTTLVTGGAGLYGRQITEACASRALDVHRQPQSGSKRAVGE